MNAKTKKYRNGQLTVAGLIEELKELPQDRSIICQLVPAKMPAQGEASAWNMFFPKNAVDIKSRLNKMNNDCFNH